MNQGKIILFYKFVAVSDTDSVRLWQKNLCENLSLKGRIIIAEHGINGTLGGPIKKVKEYVREMNQHPLFAGIRYKWSDGDEKDFPKLSVKVRPELITLAPQEKFDVFDSSKSLKPSEWHEYLEKHPDTTVLDARNDYESDIGAFKGNHVIKPKIRAFKQIKKELKKLPKDEPILTYCTGDIRCEYLSAYMVHLGFLEVYHLDGGIVKYGQKYKDYGHWEGKCFVFDRRLNIGFSSSAKDIGRCVHCGTATSNHINCANKQCNRLVLICNDCSQQTTCSSKCLMITVSK
jgi:UPF0176 protein